MSMRLWTACCAATVAVGLALLGTERQAAASVADVFSVNPNPITAGDQATLALQINLFADPNDFNAQFTGGTVTLYDGLGDSQAFNITAGLTTETFRRASTYPNAGGFTPYFTVSASYSEHHTYFSEVYQQIGGYYYTCGPSGRQCLQPTFG